MFSRGGGGRNSWLCGWRVRTCGHVRDGSVSLVALVLSVDHGPGPNAAERFADYVRDHHFCPAGLPGMGRGDRKSTRLNSSHVAISYAVFCLKKKKNTLTISI